MTEEKLNIVFPELENEEFKFLGYKIIVKPYLSLNDKAVLMREYIENLSEDNLNDLPARYLLAEYALIAQILETNTNIEIEGLDIDSAMREDGLWVNIKKRIHGYYDFRDDLEKLIRYYQFEKKLDKSVGNVLDGLSAKVIEVLNKISEMDANTIREASNNFTSELNKLNEKIPGIAGKPVSRGKKSKVE